MHTAHTRRICNSLYATAYGSSVVVISSPSGADVFDASGHSKCSLHKHNIDKYRYPSSLVTKMQNGTVPLFILPIKAVIALYFGTPNILPPKFFRYTTKSFILILWLLFLSLPAIIYHTSREGGLHCYSAPSTEALQWHSDNCASSTEP